MSESTQFKGLEARILRTLDEATEYPTAVTLARQYKIGKVKIKAALANLAEAGAVRVGDELGSIGDNDPIERAEPYREPEEGGIFFEGPEPEPEPKPKKRVGRKPLMEIEVREYTPEELEAMTPEERKALKRAKRQARRRAARAAKKAQN